MSDFRTFYAVGIDSLDLSMLKTFVEIKKGKLKRHE